MVYRKLGRSGVKVSRLGFGSMRLPMVKIGSEYFVDIGRSVDIMQYAFRRGVNYVDAGFLYCNNESEIAVGKALKGWRDKITLVTKATKLRMENPGDLRRMLEHQLYKLDTDYIDFYCFHGIGWENFHSHDKKTGWIKDLKKAHEEGLVKHIGFSFHDKPQSMFKLVDLGYFEMVTCQYNYLDRKNAEAMAYAKKEGLGTVVMGPVGGGRLAGMPGFLKDKKDIEFSNAANLALRFVFSNPSVDVVLSGMNSKKMVAENVKASEEGALNREEYKKINGLLEKTEKMAEIYCTGCGYCMPCAQGVNIPGRFEALVAYKVYGMKEYARRVYHRVREEEKKTDGKGICIECGECEKKCPQDIEIIKQLKETEKILGKKG